MEAATLLFESFSLTKAFQDLEHEFNPPYGSPIEDDFALNIVKYLRPEIKFRPQYPVETPAGRFFIDFVADQSNHRIAMECDGRQFHERMRDQWRDAQILATGQISAIYRIPGWMIWSEIERTLYMLCRCEPRLFRERAIVHLTTLGQADMLSFEKSRDRALLKYKSWPGEWEHCCDDQDPEDSEDVVSLSITRRLFR